jgi:hypothetical protein
MLGLMNFLKARTFSLRASSVGGFRSQEPWRIKSQSCRLHRWKVGRALPPAMLVKQDSIVLTH